MSNEEEKQPEVTEEKEAEAAEEKKEEEAEEKQAEEAEAANEEEDEEGEAVTTGKADTPDFERVEDHKFEKDEEVYMIDPNGFDLWEGVVEKVDGEKISIHYPDFPQDDETVEGTQRVLVRTDKNKEIYNKQEEIRHLKEEEEEVHEKKDKRKKKNKN